MSKSYQDKRRFVRWILILTTLIVPFIKVNGNSFLRFDVGELIFYFFGFPLPINNFFFILLLTLFFTFLFITMTLMYGRIWCGWLCPQSVVMEVTSFVDKVKKGETGKKTIYTLYLLVLSVVISLNMVFISLIRINFFQHFLPKGIFIR